MEDSRSIVATVVATDVRNEFDTVTWGRIFAREDEYLIKEIVTKGVDEWTMEFGDIKGFHKSQF